MFPELSVQAILTIEYLAGKLGVSFGVFVRRLEQIITAPGSIPFAPYGANGREILSLWFGGRLPSGSADMVDELMVEMSRAYNPKRYARMDRAKDRRVAEISRNRKVFDAGRMTVDKLKEAWEKAGMRHPSGRHTDEPTFGIEFIEKSGSPECSMNISYGFRNGYPMTTGSEISFSVHKTWLGRVALRKMAVIDDSVVLDLMLSGETDDFEIFYGTIVEQHRGFKLDVHEAAIVRHVPTKMASHALTFSDAKEKLVKKLLKAKLVPRNKYR